MKLLATILAGYASVSAQDSWYNNGTVYSSTTDPEMMEMAANSAAELGIDLRARQRKPKPERILIDQNWSDFDQRSSLLFSNLYPGLDNDKDFQMNAEEIQREDEKICQSGVDPIKGKPVECASDERSGMLAPVTSFQTSPRKFRQLKMLVLWLQKTPRFGNYCYYGCYCLPEGSHNLQGGGYGEPVDRVDRTCKQFNQCYLCAQLGNGEIEGTSDECVGEYTKYRFQLVTDPDGAKSITCRNRPNTCQRHICECDKRMAEDLAKYEDEWDVTYHTGRNNGAWKYEENCHKKGMQRYTKPETCCGNEFPNLRPKQGGKECCGALPWDPTRQTDKQCCNEERIRPAEAIC